MTDHCPGLVYSMTRGEQLWLHCSMCATQHFSVFKLLFNGKAGCSVIVDCISSVIVVSKWLNILLNLPNNERA